MTFDELQHLLTGNLHQFDGLGAVVRFDFGEAGYLQIDGSGDAAALSEAEAAPDCTLRLSLEDAVLLLQGDLNAKAAFAKGRIGVEGPIMIAAKLQKTLAKHQKGKTELA
ncbi:MAG: SCP2 sterol-binding domain-containing protein [Magnetospiraceae bacterium]